jgi:hypothetical protein
MKNGTTTSSRNAAISPYSSDIARILLGNIHGRADAPHPALAGCAHAVSGHVAAVHIGSFLRRGNPDPRMSLVGHTRSFGDVRLNVRFARKRTRLGDLWARRYRVEAARLTLPFRPVERLAQVQESGCACGEARGRGGLEHAASSSSNAAGANSRKMRRQFNRGQIGMRR